jgi:hypothetical protein
MAEMKREPAPSESQRKQMWEFAGQRDRICRATESSLEPDSSGQPSSAVRAVGCFVDAGAVSATAPVQNPKRVLQRFVNACREEART